MCGWVGVCAMVQKTRKTICSNLVNFLPPSQNTIKLNQIGIYWKIWTFVVVRLDVIWWKKEEKSGQLRPNKWVVEFHASRKISIFDFFLRFFFQMKLDEILNIFISMQTSKVFFPHLSRSLHTISNEKRCHSRIQASTWNFFTKYSH